MEAWKYKGSLEKAPVWIRELAEQGQIYVTPGSSDVLTVRLFEQGIDVCNVEDFIVKDGDSIRVGRAGVFEDEYEEVEAASGK